MRIVQFMDSGGLYGAEQMVLQLAAGLKERGHSVSLALPAESSSGSADSLEREAAALGVDIWHVGGRAGPAAIRRLLSRCRAESVGVIHSHGYKAHILLGLFGSGRTSPANVATLHGWTARRIWSRVGMYGILERCLLHRFEAVVAVHDDMPQLSSLPRRVRRRLTVIHNGLPAQVPQVVQPDLDDLHAFRSPGRTIGAVGRLSPEKGIDVLIEAMALLRDAGDPARLVVVGDGSQRAVLEERVKELRLHERVLFAGFLPRAGNILPLFDLLALPSWQEGLPIVLLEAMRARVPIVATGVGGVVDLLEKGACGKLVPPGDPQVLAVALAATLDRPDEARAKAERAWERFASNFSAESMIESYLECYALAAAAKSALRRRPA